MEALSGVMDKLQDRVGEVIAFRMATSPGVDLGPDPAVPSL